MFQGCVIITLYDKLLIEIISDYCNNDKDN